MTLSAHGVPAEELPEDSVVGGGRYIIERRIAVGGAAAVYRARRSRDHRLVALKVLDDRLADEPRQVARFENELRIGQSVADEIPAIVRPLEFGRLLELDGRPFVAFEYVDAVDLQRSGRFQPLVACEIVRQVTTTIIALHAHGIIHRDLKPSNLMLEQATGCVRVIDLGFAYSKGNGGIAPATAGLTLVDERLGTKHYMPPEQLMGLPPAPMWDVFALASTLYELVGGHPPYAGCSSETIAYRKCVVKKSPAPLRFLVRDALHPKLIAFVEDGMALEPDRRIMAMDVFVERLDEVIEALRAEATGPSQAASNDEALPALPAIGTVVGAGRFEIRGLLGQEGTALCTTFDRTLNREVAMRLLVPRALGDAAQERRFLAEAELLRRVGPHPHILEVLAEGRLSDHHDWPFVATRLVDGQPLHRTLANGGISLREVAVLARQLADALRACHRAGVVHRNVNVSSVLLDEARQRAPVLVDFALATHVGEASETDPSIDVLSFGMLLYELLTANQRKADAPIVRKATTEVGHPRIDRKLHPEIPEGLARMVDDCLANRGSRLTMHEVVPRLDAVIAAMGLPSPIESTQPEMIAFRETSRRTEPATAATDPFDTAAPGSDPKPIFRLVSTTAPVVQATPEPRITADAAQVAEEGPEQENRRAPKARVRNRAIGVVGALAFIGIVWGALVATSEPKTAQPPSDAGLGLAASTGAAVEAGRGEVEPEPEIAHDDALKPPRHDPDPAPEPGPESEPGERVAPKPSAHPKHRDRPKAPIQRVPPEPAPPDPQGEQCTGQRQRANNAYVAHNWTSLLFATRDRACWRPSMSKRADLRVRAFFKLGRFTECARLERAASLDVRRLVNLCKSKAETSP